MSDLILSNLTGSSVSVSRGQRGRLSEIQDNSSATYSAEEITRVLGDPREHSQVKGVVSSGIAEWLALANHS